MLHKVRLSIWINWLWRLNSRTETNRYLTNLLLQMVLSLVAVVPEWIKEPSQIDKICLSTHPWICRAAELKLAKRNDMGRCSCNSWSQWIKVFYEEAAQTVRMTHTTQATLKGAVVTMEPKCCRHFHRKCLRSHRCTIYKTFQVLRVIILMPLTTIMATTPISTT
jgi:hypothetical protein